MCCRVEFILLLSCKLFCDIVKYCVGFKFVVHMPLIWKKLPTGLTLPTFTKVLAYGTPLGIDGCIRKACVKQCMTVITELVIITSSAGCHSYIIHPTE